MLDVCEVLEVAGGGGFGGSGEGDVFAGVDAAGEAGGPGIEHAADDFFSRSFSPASKRWKNFDFR